MNEFTVACFIENNKDYLFPNDDYTEQNVTSALLAAPDSFEHTMSSISFQDPDHIKRIAIFPGVLGVDRFYLGDIKNAFLKYITFGGLWVWWIKDIFSAKDRCRSYNCKKLMEALTDPSVVGQMRKADSTLTGVVDKAKKFAPIAKDLAKGAKDIGSTFYVDP